MRFPSKEQARDRLAAAIVELEKSSTIHAERAAIAADVSAWAAVLAVADEPVQAEVFDDGEGAKWRHDYEDVKRIVAERMWGALNDHGDALDEANGPVEVARWCEAANSAIEAVFDELVEQYGGV